MSARRAPCYVLLAVVTGLSVTSARSASHAVADDAEPPRWYDETHVARGAEVFARHCAGCHGERAQGAADWRRRDASGKLPPPPLDGTGHAWHHPSAVLMKVILEGSPQGGSMPGWAGTITANDAASVIAWFQSRWPDEIYAAWYRIELQARRGQ
ncbi:MAG: cytochrome c [Gammaproteobacteria bacterium]|nr:cytochrome c [Gammaproteobacteria bacterium]